MPRRCAIVLTLWIVSGLMTGCGEGEPPLPPRPATKAKTATTICLLAGQKGAPYFTHAAEGALEAMENTGGIELKYDGPKDISPAKAATIIEKWTQEGADLIAVSPDGSKAVADAMRSARENGVRVIAWGATSQADTSDFCVTPAGTQRIASAIVETLIKDLGAAPNGEVAVITTTMEDSNRLALIEATKARLQQAGLNVVDVKPCNDNSGLAGQAAKTLIDSHPKLRAIIALSPAALTGAGQTIRRIGKTSKICLTGLAGPGEVRTYIMDGTVKSAVFWNPKDLGYLTMKLAIALVKGKFNSGDKSLQAGRLGTRTVTDDALLLGDILIFNKDNVNKFDF